MPGRLGFSSPPASNPPNWTEAHCHALLDVRAVMHFAGPQNLTVGVLADTFLVSIGGDGITGKRIYEPTRELPPSQVLASKLTQFLTGCRFHGNASESSTQQQ